MALDILNSDCFLSIENPTFLKFYQNISLMDEDIDHEGESDKLNNDPITQYTPIKIKY